MSEHPVTVDEESVARTFDALGAETPADSAQNPGEGSPEGGEAHADAPPPPSATAMQIGMLLASIVANKVAPNWQVPHEVQVEWATAAAACIDSMFPNGVNNLAAMGPWGRLLVASGMFVLAGFDVEKFQFKPLHKPPLEGESERVEEPPPREQQSEQPAATGGGFKTA